MIVLGSNSQVAQAFVEEALKKGMKFPTIYLLSSNRELAEKFAHHLGVKYFQMCEVIELDITKEINYQRLDYVDSSLLFCATGYLGLSSEKGLYNKNNTQRVIDINYAKLVPVVQFFAEKMQAKRMGTIIGLSSVAGERGRQSNLIYGSAKAGFSAYLSGLRNFLQSYKVHVMSVKPGFMQTKMTQDLQLNPFLTATPKQAAEKIINALEKKKDTVYVLPIWRFIMLIIRNIPEFIFKKLKL